MKILTAGGINIEFVTHINEFPLEYKNIYFKDEKISVGFGGVGYNITKALSKLGAEIDFLTYLGNDNLSTLIESELTNSGINYISQETNKNSLISNILVDKEGRRTIIRDGKNDYLYKYNNSILNSIDFKKYDFAAIGMNQYNLDLVKHLTKNDIKYAVDLQGVNNLNNKLFEDYLKTASVVFFSSEGHENEIDNICIDLYNKYKIPLIGVGNGKNGSLLVINGDIHKYSAPNVKVVNTVGAGDALFSSFIYFYTKYNDSNLAIKRATRFVGHKIMFDGATNGFLSEEELNNLK